MSFAVIKALADDFVLRNRNKKCVEAVPLMYRVAMACPELTLEDAFSTLYIALGLHPDARFKKKYDDWYIIFKPKPSRVKIQDVIDERERIKRKRGRKYLDFGKVREDLGYQDPDPTLPEMEPFELSNYPCTLLRHGEGPVEGYHVNPQIMQQAERYERGSKALWQQEGCKRG